LSFIELRIFVCCLGVFVGGTLAKWLPGNATILVSVLLKGFPYKDQIEELFIIWFHFAYSQ